MEGTHCPMRLKPLGQECMLLDICDVQLLLECPIDVSALSLFLPTNQKPPLFPKKRKTGLDVPLPFVEAVEGSGKLFVDAEPWYKTPALQLVDVALVNAIVISNPTSMLGLPFFTRDPDFTGKVFVTDAAATLGGILLRELVASHSEYTKLYGRSTTSTGKDPSWISEDLVSKLPADLKESLLGNWRQLYSADDVKNCLQRVCRLNFGEEAAVDECVTLKPFSSGFSIGAANWMFKCPYTSVAYISDSSLGETHAASFDFSCGTAPPLLLLSDLRSFQHVKDDSSEKKAAASPFQGNRPWITAPVKFLTTQSKPQLFKPVQVPEAGKSSPMQAVCNSVVEAVSKGGSVLLPTNMSDKIIELAETISLQLAAANFGHVPLFFISPFAEDFLALINTFPEWVSATRQEKMYAGEPSFYLDKKRFHHLRTLSSPEAIEVWKEPCIAFASHSSLRMGPSVHLLQRWRCRPDCLLVLTDRDFEQEATLCPFKPLSLQVLCSPLTAGLRLLDVEPLFQRLRPRVSLVPEVLRTTTLEVTQPLFYSKTVVEVTEPEDNPIIVEVSSDLSNRVKPPPDRTPLPLAGISTDMYFRQGTIFFEASPPASKVTTGKSYCGTLEMEAVLRALKGTGLGDDIQVASTSDSSWIISLRCSPASSAVELHISPGSCCIKADDPVVRTLVANAVRSLLQPTVT